MLHLTNAPSNDAEPSQSRASARLRALAAAVTSLTYSEMTLFTSLMSYALSSRVSQADTMANLLLEASKAVLLLPCETCNSNVSTQPTSRHDIMLGSQHSQNASVSGLPPRKITIKDGSP